MSRQPKNEAFARTSFLQGTNATYIEQMQEQYERNPGSVTDEWRHFFASMHEETRRPEPQEGQNGPSWARPLDTVSGNSDLMGALTGDYGAEEKHLRDRLQQHAHTAGFEISPAASFRAIQDSIRALMLIRAYAPWATWRRISIPSPHRAQGAQGASPGDLRLHRG